MSRLTKSPWAVAVLSVAAACAPQADQPDTERAAEAVAPALVTFQAHEFGFSGPDTVSAGLTTVRLVNQGVEFHHVTLVRLSGDHDRADLVASFEAGQPTPEWAEYLGGPNPVVPGSALEATMELPPGRYLLVCDVPSPDGTVHSAKGMVRELEVVGPAPTVPYDPPTITLDLTDYSFTWSVMPGPGQQRIRVRNVGPQWHEVVMVRLADGARATDVLGWLEGGMAGPPPFTPTGGVAPLGPGGVNDIVLDLEPGRYALLCFLSDAGDRAPHFVHGMIDEIEITAEGAAG
jgi:hypothetical protein